MKGFLILLGTSAAGWTAWWLCEGLDVMIQYTVSVIASGFGFYYTRKLLVDLLG